MTSKPNKTWLWFSIALIVFFIFLDQWFKVHIKTTMELHTETPVFGNWFKLHFTENPGMAFGMQLQFLGQYGKVGLSVFRLIAVVFGFYILVTQVAKGAKPALLICISLILAGAIGNLIDSIFYGVYFKEINEYVGGYFHGHVVDMLYFPIVEGHYWNWIPKLGGQQFTFFSPVFNLADTFISTGAIAIFVFQKRFFKSEEDEKQATTMEQEAEIIEDEPIAEATQTIDHKTDDTTNL